jgi:hypothetical protein
MDKSARPVNPPLPAPVGRMLVLATLALCGGVGLTIGLARSEYETFTGYLQARGRTVTAGRDARIAGVLVKQGQVAQPGTPLLTLSDMQLEETRAAKQRQVAALEAELAQIHAQAAIEIAGRRQKLEAEIFETKLKSAQYLKGMQEMAQRPNVVCKISGIVVTAPKNWTPDDLAPNMNFTMETFGHDRIMFAGDWPVCTLRAAYRQWLGALQTIVNNWSSEDKRKLFHDNAVRFYGLTKAGT